MRLAYDLCKQLARPDHLGDFNWYARLFGLCQSAVETVVFWSSHIWKTQLPHLIIAHCFHEGIGHPYRDVEVSNRVFVGLASNKFFNVRMVDAQHSHIRPAPATH